VVTITKEFTYSSSDQQPDHIAENGNSVLHENVYTRKINLQKRMKSRKFNDKNFWTTRKNYKFEENIALPFVPEKNVGKALSSVEDLRQWFPNCGTRTSSGTRRPSRWYTTRPTFCLSSQKKIHSCNFYLSGSVNKFLKFCVAYPPSWFLKMATKLSHSHFFHVAFISILVFQTPDRIIFGLLIFPGTRWYVLTVRP